MKKILALGLALIMSLAVFAGCNGKGSSGKEVGLSGGEVPDITKEEFSEMLDKFIPADAVEEYRGEAVLQFSSEETPENLQAHVEKALKEIGAKELSNNKELADVAIESGATWAYYGTYGDGTSVIVTMIPMEGDRTTVAVTLT